MKLKTIIISLAMIFNASQLMAKNVEMLIFDSNKTEANGLPRNFRDLSKFGLNAIASAQFSEKELQKVREKYPNEKIIIVDLRREPHGIINGEAVSWREEFDKSQSNSGKKNFEIIADEKSRLNIAKKDGEILINKTLEKDKKNGWFKEVQPQIVVVQEALSEESLAKKYGFEYKRIAIQDHAKPDQERFKEIINFIKNLPQDKKIYVHCAGGKGRTTSFLAFYDIMKNGDKLTFEEILERQYKAGGGKLYEIDEEEKGEFRTKLAEERFNLIAEFYEKNLENSRNLNNK